MDTNSAQLFLVSHKSLVYDHLSLGIALLESTLFIVQNITVNQ